MKLSDTQRLYVQTIYEYFRWHGKWPAYGYIGRVLAQISGELDIEKVAKSLPMGYATALAFNHDLKADAVLSISAINACDGSEEDLADFVKALNFCVEKYFSAGGGAVEVSSDELVQQLHMTDLTVRKIGHLIRGAYEYPIYSVFGAKDAHYDKWTCTLSRSIRRFNGVMSIAKYLEKIDPAHVFQSFARELLKSSGYENIVEPEGYRDLGYDFQVTYPATSLQDTPHEQKLFVQVKYRNLGGQLSVDMMDRFVKEYRAYGADKALFVTNTTATPQTSRLALNNGAEIWDASKLLSLLEGFPELKQQYSEAIVEQLDDIVISSEPVSDPPDEYDELIKKLRELPTGDGKAYEDIVKKILEICFREDFTPFKVKEQIITDNEKRIRDFIIDNRSPRGEFWLSLKLVRRVEKLLFDAKNYKNPITYSEISGTIRYLDFNKAFGDLLIVISRNGVKDNKEFIEVFSKKERIILCLNDEDLIRMLKLSKAGERAASLIENKYFDLLDTQ